MSNIYEQITDRILREMEGGNIPWTKEWTNPSGSVSHATGKPYSLLNQLLLLDEGETVSDLESFKSREFATFNQIKAEGGHVRKGEKSKWLVFSKQWKKESVDESTGEKTEEVIPVLRWYNVFEVSQCDGIERKYEPTRFDNDPVAEAERVIDEYFSREECTLEVMETGRASYSPKKDRVKVPLMSQFTTSESYYSTLFHEMVHSTGHIKRLQRMDSESNVVFGDDDYSNEELVAELGSAYMMNRLGLDNSKTERNSAGYLQGWMKALKDNRRLFVSAAAKAEKAVNYILGNEKNKSNETDDREN